MKTILLASLLIVLSGCSSIQENNEAQEEEDRKEVEQPSTTEDIPNSVETNGIFIEDSLAGEPDWLRLENREAGFAIDYPRDMFPGSDNKNIVFSLGPDGHFMIKFYNTREELDEAINAYWSHKHNRQVSKTSTTVGDLEAEKIIVTAYTDDKHEFYIIEGREGFFELSYYGSYYDRFDEILQTFRLLE